LNFRIANVTHAVMKDVKKPRGKRGFLVFIEESIIRFRFRLPKGSDQKTNRMCRLLSI